MTANPRSPWLPAPPGAICSACGIAIHGLVRWVRALGWAWICPECSSTNDASPEEFIAAQARPAPRRRRWWSR